MLDHVGEFSSRSAPSVGAARDKRVEQGGPEEQRERVAADRQRASNGQRANNARPRPHIEPAPASTRVAAFFDLDKTIIAKSSTLAFSRPLFKEGLINRRAVLKSAYAQFVFMLSGADADQTERMRDYITQLCAGWDVEQVRAIVDETLHDIVDPLVYAEAAELIAEHKAAGHDVVVISATGEEISAPIATMLGATTAVGTRMVVADGRYTGEIEFYCYGANKAVAVAELANQHGYDLAACHGYTDSSTDLPMLEAVGHPCAVNPDRALRKAAAERDWPVLTFSNPVSLRSRMFSSSGATLAMTAVGLGAVAAGATWYGLFRRRRG
ncbi:MAG: HAD-IB family hydrolase [Pseudonocardiaceae bacterium]|nr:HAD-IB family hydrolase [Pseudonocardiaceae bacterium]